eukprot:8918706-Pyramimonas_sp.AAC.1
MATIRSAREALKGRGKGKSAPNRRPTKLQSRVGQRKRNTSSWDCGETGHWTGDKECPAPGARKFAPKDGKSKGGGRGGRGGRPQRQARITEQVQFAGEEIALHPQGP